MSHYYTTDEITGKRVRVAYDRSATVAQSVSELLTEFGSHRAAYEAVYTAIMPDLPKAGRKFYSEVAGKLFQLGQETGEFHTQGWPRLSRKGRS